MSGLRGIKKRRERREKEGVNFYRSAKETLPEKMRKKLMESTTWYKEDEGNNEQREKTEFTKSSWEGNAGDDREGEAREKKRYGVRGGRISKPKERGGIMGKQKQ